MPPAQGRRCGAFRHGGSGLNSAFPVRLSHDGVRARLRAITDRNQNLDAPDEVQALACGRLRPPGETT